VRYHYTWRYSLPVSDLLFSSLLNCGKKIVESVKVGEMSSNAYQQMKKSFAGFLMSEFLVACFLVSCSTLFQVFHDASRPADVRYLGVL